MILELYCEVLGIVKTKSKSKISTIYYSTRKGGAKNRGRPKAWEARGRATQQAGGAPDHSS